MDTRATLIDRAIGIVRKTGYAGFSYADLSAVVHIRKASIHHHFPTKADLGLAMVETYHQAFARLMVMIVAAETTRAKRLRRYADVYRGGVRDGNGCLCGVLAAEAAELPEPVRAAVRAFFDDNTAWIEGVLAEGGTSGEVEPITALVRQRARMVLATLQGALLVACAQGDVEVFDAATSAVIAAVGDRAERP